MSDTPETDALLRQQDRDCTPYDRTSDQLVKLCRKLERERDEARQQEQIHHDNTLAMQKERDNALTELEMWRDGCIVREEDKVERDQWRRCAEGLAFIVKNSAADYSILRDREAALAEFERLKEASK